MAKLIECKSCTNLIAVTAKSCPTCGAPNKYTKMSTKIIGGFFAVVLIITFIGPYQSGSQSSSVPKPAKGSSEPVQPSKGEKQPTEKIVQPTNGIVIEKTTKFVPTADDVIGQWRLQITNPTLKNTVAQRYMRHSFFADGTLQIENKEDTQEVSKWEFTDGTIVVSTTSGTDKYIKYYVFLSRDELEKIRFKSIVDGKIFVDRKEDDKYIRQGSNLEKNKKIYSIFETTRSALDFINPNTLETGSTYTLSKRTPLMPQTTPSSVGEVFSALDKVVYLQAGEAITITSRKKVRNVIWYGVESGANTGWVNSIALIGQNLKQ
ncbi:MAG: hypothetical protein GXP14_03730 [Gammaproteobacteria bacterium]|nr:hypothetical protein [Gammaproteobacteria bacterium]